LLVQHESTNPPGLAEDVAILDAANAGDDQHAEGKVRHPVSVVGRRRLARTLLRVVMGGGL
jgi:hypothetical protein